jgi:hypothetical protein
LFLFPLDREPLGQSNKGFAIETASCGAGTFDIVLVGSMLNSLGAPNVFRDARSASAAIDY